MGDREGLEVGEGEGEQVRELLRAAVALKDRLRVGEAEGLVDGTVEGVTVRLTERVMVVREADGVVECEGESVAVKEEEGAVGVGGTVRWYVPDCVAVWVRVRRKWSLLVGVTLR